MTTRRSGNQGRKFWYLDYQGILGLEFQCKEFARERRGAAGNSLKGRKLGLQLAVKAMGEIFGSARAKSYALYSASSGHHPDAGKEAERRLKKLMTYLTDQGALVCLGGIGDFLKIENSALPLFCTAGLRFLLDSKFYLESSMARSVGHSDQDGLVSLIRKNKFVVLRADLRGGAVRRPRWQRVTMGAGLGKWASVHLNESGSPEFETSSQLDQLLRTSIDAPIHLDFFGHMIRAGEGLYIKPFAIW